MILKINSSKCTGCGICVCAMSGNIELDPRNRAIVIVKHITPGFEPVAQQLQENCPGGALEVE
jgi:ferredoxin